SLRESKTLARGGCERPWYRRPLWRGAMIVSIWFAFTLLIAIPSQWQPIREYWKDALTIQDPQVLLEKLSAAQQTHALGLFTLGLGILQRLLQPLLGIAFVVLYFDSKSRND